MVNQREVRAKLAIDPDYLSKLEAESKPPKALGCSVIPPNMQ
jgi:hypothetical protein